MKKPKGPRKALIQMQKANRPRKTRRWNTRRWKQEETSKNLQSSRPRGEKTQIPELAFSPFSDTFLLLLVRMLHVSELISLP